MLSSCKDDDFTTSPDFRLSFSVDTLTFDTIFTTIGSATRVLKVYNRSRDAVRIQRIDLENDPNDSFRLNVDGLPGIGFTDVEIRGNDSLFIFVEVTIEPGVNELYPFVDGAIRFTLDAAEQRLPLVAWGWDAIFYPRAGDVVVREPGLPPYYFISEETGTINWTPDRPIVVRNYLVIGNGQRLNVQPGTQVFFHQGGGLWILPEGNITASGTLDQPIVFQGDRLEPFYSEQPGQWDRIWINEGSQDNTFENVLIKNNFIGLQVEPLPFGNASDQLSTNALILKNVMVRNNSIASMLVRNYRVDASNIVLSRAGQHVLVTQGAGQYRFDHCTFANNWNLSIRQSPAVFLTNLYRIDDNTVGVGTILPSRFRNCIIHGNGFNEFGLDFDRDNAEVDLKLSHCLIRADVDVILAAEQDNLFQDSIWVNNQPGFVNFAAGNFLLREDAFVRGKGLNATNLPTTDLFGTPYNVPRPLGALEYRPE